MACAPAQSLAFLRLDWVNHRGVRGRQEAEIARRAATDRATLSTTMAQITSRGTDYANDLNISASFVSFGWVSNRVITQEGGNYRENLQFYAGPGFNLVPVGFSYTSSAGHAPKGANLVPTLGVGPVMWQLQLHFNYVTMSAIEQIRTRVCPLLFLKLANLCILLPNDSMSSFGFLLSEQVAGVASGLSIGQSAKS